MRPNSLFVENCNIVAAAPADMSGSGGLVVPAVRLRHYDRATLVFIKAAGTAGDDPTITITQGDGISAGNLTNAKAVNFTRVDTKRHASAVPTTYTTETQSAANTYTSATLAEELGHVVIDITAEMLDTDNGFDCVKAAIADVGTNAQLGCLFWVLSNANHKPPLAAQS